MVNLHHRSGLFGQWYFVFARCWRSSCRRRGWVLMSCGGNGSKLTNIYSIQMLGGGFKYFFYVHPTWGKWSNLTNMFQIGLKPPTRMGWNIKLVEGIHTYTFLLVYIPTGGNDPIYFPKNYATENLKTNDLHEPNLHYSTWLPSASVFGIVPLVNSFKFRRCLYIYILTL